MNKALACPEAEMVGLSYTTLQNGLLDFLRARHGYKITMADDCLAAGFGAAVDGVTLAVCREFRALYPAYALYAMVHHGGHGQHIRACDHRRMLELLDLMHVPLAAAEKQKIIHEIYEQDHDVSCIGLGLLADAFEAGYLKLPSHTLFDVLIAEMQDYYVHDASEFLRCLETGTMPRLTHMPARTSRHPWVQDLTLKNRQPVLPARQLPTALVFHVGRGAATTLSAQSDHAMRRQAAAILQKI